MRVGVAIDETWAFFKDLYAELDAHHDVHLFQRRTFDLPIFHQRANRRLFRRDLQRFLASSDVVFFEWASELLAAASQLSPACGVVTRLHRYEMYRWAQRIEWDAVDRVILVSDAKRREFARRFPQHADKVIVIPEAISLQHFRPQERPFRGDIGILCHLRPRKRVYELILAFYELAQQRDDLHLHIGGGEAPGFAEYYEAIQTLIGKLKLEKRVTMYGHVADAAQWFQNIDIFISNSYSEGLQVSPMEAIASGRFCLSHHWDGADELLPADNLFFTDRQLQERILEYCDAPEAEKRRQRERQQAIVCQHFDVERIKVQVREVIEAAADSRCKPLLASEDRS